MCRLCDSAYPSSYSFTGSISPASCALILTQYKSSFSTYTILFIRSVTPTLSLIPSTPGAAFSTTTTPTGIENVRVYLVITISIHVNIVYKLTKIAKNIQAIDRQLNKLKDSLSKIKDKLAFIRHGITTLIHNAKLPDIEFK